MEPGKEFLRAKRQTARLDGDVGATESDRWFAQKTSVYAGWRAASERNRTTARCVGAQRDGGGNQLLRYAGPGPQSNPQSAPGAAAGDRSRIFSGHESARNRRSYEYTFGDGEDTPRIGAEKDLRRPQG